MQVAGSRAYTAAASSHPIGQVVIAANAAQVDVLGNGLRRGGRCRPLACERHRRTGRRPGLVFFIVMKQERLWWLWGVRNGRHFPECEIDHPAGDPACIIPLV